MSSFTNWVHLLVLMANGVAIFKLGVIASLLLSSELLFCALSVGVWSLNWKLEFQMWVWYHLSIFVIFPIFSSPNVFCQREKVLGSSKVSDQSSQLHGFLIAYYINPLLLTLCFTDSIIKHLFSEVILTLGSSKTVLEFLYAAKEKKRSFRVFVAEGAPRFVQVTLC
jgi:hypothetical protein